jgi:hypothetical protein
MQEKNPHPAKFCLKTGIAKKTGVFYNGDSRENGGATYEIDHIRPDEGTGPNRHH